MCTPMGSCIHRAGVNLTASRLGSLNSDPIFVHWSPATQPPIRPYSRLQPSRISTLSWHSLLLSHGLRAIKGFADDVGMASMLGGFGDDVEQCASCGAGRPGLEPGGGWERVAGVEVREVEHELIGAVGDGLVTVEERSEGVPV